jgi:drug/metabolite transporter (DMT)-like permease
MIEGLELEIDPYDVDVRKDEEEQALLKKEQEAEENRLQASIRAVRFLLLLGCNIALWYFTNGFNGIAMQSYAKTVRTHDSHNDMLFVNIAIMAAVTSLQLGLGALLGYGLLKGVIYRFTHTDINLSSMTTEEVIAGSLHGLGSISTNLGFMYGSASLVQILKLLEPFETLGLSQLLTPQEGNFTFGIVSSMMMVVGAAVSLIRIQPKKPHINSVIFALLSGMSLSLRNVLQRKSHTTRQDQKTPEEKQSTTPLKKMERSVIQFTQLSFRSAILVGGVAVVLNMLALPQMHALASLNWRVLTWHPLYNVFSMITLGFCSALTHSLLNSGKRVFAILMAILWFGEDITMATIAGLSTVAGGGVWYTLEAKGQRIVGGCAKIFVAVAVLYALFDYQSVNMMKHG